MIKTTPQEKWEKEKNGKKYRFSAKGQVSTSVRNLTATVTATSVWRFGAAHEELGLYNALIQSVN